MITKTNKTLSFSPRSQVWGTLFQSSSNGFHSYTQVAPEAVPYARVRRLQRDKPATHSIEDGNGRRAQGYRIKAQAKSRLNASISRGNGVLQVRVLPSGAGTVLPFSYSLNVKRVPTLVDYEGAGHCESVALYSWPQGFNVAPEFKRVLEWASGAVLNPASRFASSVAENKKDEHFGAEVEA